MANPTPTNPPPPPPPPPPSSSPPQDVPPPPDGEDVLQRVRNLMRRITAGRPSPHPRFLHNLAAILEQEEASFEKEAGNPSPNNARSLHTIGRLINLIKENDDFFELLSSKLLVEPRHSMAVRAAAARLLLACLSCGTYPDVFEDTVLANIKQWVAEDAGKHASEGPSPKRPGNQGTVRVKKFESADWEMLRTYSTGLLAVALMAGGGVVEEVLTTGVAAKLMHFLRVRVLRESSNPRDLLQVPENRVSNGAMAVRNRDDARTRVRLPLEVSRMDALRDEEELVEDQEVEKDTERSKFMKGKIMEDGNSVHENLIGCRVASEDSIENSVCTYDADNDTDWASDEKRRKKEWREGKNRAPDWHGSNRPSRDEDMEEAGRGEPSRRRWEVRVKLRGKGRLSDGIVEGEKDITSPTSGLRIGNTMEKSKGQRDRSVVKIGTGIELRKDVVGKDTNNDVDNDVDEDEREFDRYDIGSRIGDLDFSMPIKKAARAAEAEARAAKAPVEAVKAAGEAAADLVKAAAVEALAASNDKDTALAAAAAAAATVVDAAVTTKSIRKDLDLCSGLAEEESEDKEVAVLNFHEFADLGDCVLDAESLANLREQFCVQCLEKMGEYLEVLGPVLHERGVDVCLALLQRESGDGAYAKDKAMLSDVLKLICALAAHRKFAALFVDRGGVQQLLLVPRVPQTYTGISLCLFAFASLQGVMERVCTLLPNVVNEVVALALHLLECAQDSARRNAALFFGAAFVFRAIIDAFDTQDGLGKMLNLLRNAATLRSGGGTGAPGSSSTSTGSRIDRGASAEVLTSSEKQTASHTCVALRQYFRAHLLMLVDSLRPCKGRGGSRSINSGRAAYKPLDLSNEAMETVLLQLQRDRKLGPVFVRARWPALEKFMNYNGHSILLELTQVSPGEKYLYESAQHALGVLQIVTLMPYTRRLVVGCTLSNERSGMAVILDAASAAGFGDPEVIQPALLVLVNLVCPPPSLCSRPAPPPSINTASQQICQISVPGFGTSNFEGKERQMKGDGSTDRNGGDRNPQVLAGQLDNKDRVIKGDIDKNGERNGMATCVPISPVPVASPAAAVVGDRRISLGSGAGGPGLAAYMEQGYRQAREAVRANNGIKVLLHLLYPRTGLPATSLDCIRALACRVLLGLARDDVIAHILTKLQVGKLISELLRDGGSQIGRPTGVNSVGGDQGRWQAELGQVAMELIAIVTNAGRASTLAATDAAAPTLRRIERAAIAAATPISYHSRELLLLIHEHLVASGLENSAATLLKEAHLVPLPSAGVPAALPNLAAAFESSEEQLQWPVGRVPGGFLAGASKQQRENDAGSKSDQLQNFARRRVPCFSSALVVGNRTPQSLPSTGKKTLSVSKDGKQTIGRNGRSQDNQITGTPRPSIGEVSDPLKTPGSSCSLPAKRKAFDREMTLPLPGKRLALSECGGSPTSFITPGRCKGYQSMENSFLLVSPGLRDPSSRQVFGQQLHNSMLEKSDVTILQNDSGGDYQHLQINHHQSTPSHLQASAISSHASLLPELQNCQNDRATLDSLVVQYLKHQHRQCPAPITTLPPLSLLQPHVCPETSRACYAPLNTAARLATREIIPPYGGTHGCKRDRHFVYSRFRPWRTCRDEAVLLTSVTFLGSTFRLAAGSHAGDIRLFDCSSGNVLETHMCHQSPITLLQSTPKELANTVECTGSHPGQLLLSSGSYDVRLWNTSALGDGPLHIFEGCRSARFNRSGNMFAAVTSESSHREVLLYDVQTSKLEHRISDSISVSTGPLRGHAHSVHFNPSDTLMLWNGVLWDHRVPRPIHRFDQFSDYGGGGFHPAGNEAIINSEVWDLRSFKLLRSVSSLDQTVITFNATGDVIYAILRRNSEDIMSALHPRRGRHPLFRAFRTIDAVDYTDIATTPVDRCILDLATEPTDSLISLVAMDNNDEMDSFARLYEVGRRRPTDDDSDPDDGVETEDDEDSEGEEEAVEVEDLPGDGDDSDLDGSNDDDGSGDDDDAEEDADADFDSNDEDDEDAVGVGEDILEIVSDEEDDETRVSYSSGDEGSLSDFDEDFNDVLQGFF